MIKLTQILNGETQKPARPQLKDRTGSAIIGAVTQPMEDGMGNSAFDKKQVAIMATRQMAVECWTEELVALLVDTGVVTADGAALMLERLQAKLRDQSNGEYLLHPQTIEEESIRVAGLAKAYRARHQAREQ